MIDASQAEDPFVGQVVEGRYRVLAPLGQGGMGVVYRVEHMMMKKEMALKLLHPELGRSPELLKRFEREAEAAARLSHPNIIAVTDFGRTEDGRLFLVMELLRGPSLAEVIGAGEARRPLGVERSLHITRQVLRALHHAHQLGVVHRDLKPDNIVLIERDGEHDVCKLLDFGIAKLTSGEQGEAALTQTGMIFGTPEYLSPEQAVGEVADSRADLYAMGIILYEMLSGQRPFQSDSKLALVSMQVTQQAMPVVDAAPAAGIARTLSAVVERAMEKRREDRWADALLFLEALDGEGGGQEIGRTDSLVARLRRRALAIVFAVERPLAARGVPAPRALAIAALVATFVILAGGAALLVQHPGPVPTLVATPTVVVDLARAERALKTGRSCKDRKLAALEIIAAGDRREVPALESARDRRGGFFGAEKVNGCMQKDLQEGIKKLTREGP